MRSLSLQAIFSNKKIVLKMSSEEKVFPVFLWARAKQNPHPSKLTPTLQFKTDQITKINNPVFTSILKSSPKINQAKKDDEQKRSRDIRSTSLTQDGRRKKVQRTKFYEDPIQQANMVKAVDAYKTKARLPNGESPTLRNIGKFYGVKTSTLATRTNGKISIDPPKVGRKPFFTKEELIAIVNHLLMMADLGYGFTELQAMNLIRYLSTLKDPNKIKNLKGTHGFMCNLFLQFPELRKRRAQSCDYCIISA